MFSRTLFCSIIILMLCVISSSAQVMQVHIGEEILSFEVSGIDSITFTPAAEEPPIIIIDQDSLYFGQVVIERNRELMLNISNVGVDLLIIEAVELAEGAFSVDFDNPIEIRAGESHQMLVTFSPMEVGDYIEDLMITSNDMDNEEILITLFGGGFIHDGQDHYIYDITDVNMSVIIRTATIDGESLVENDEVGVFTPAGLCSGAGIIPPEFPNESVGLAAWGAEQDRDNGFHADEALSFRLWDADAQQEVLTEIEVFNGEPVYSSNGFLVIGLSAARE
ncbi:MAG: hypothetical protein HN590_03780 [Calditrichaeota bacterium]|nr:hypothetical protein [Calditrichota bacterium]